MFAAEIPEAFFWRQPEQSTAIVVPSSWSYKVPYKSRIFFGGYISPNIALTWILNMVATSNKSVPDTATETI